MAGNYKGPLDYIDVATRIVEFREKVALTETGCWEWPTRIAPNGYGRIYHAGRDYYAHRVFYTAEHGPVEPTLDIDHLCRNRRCVNPAHLEAVTRKVNLNRGAGTGPRKTHCIRGHSLADAYEDKRGGRQCRTCTMQRAAEKRAERRAA